MDIDPDQQQQQQQAAPTFDPQVMATMVAQAVAQQNQFTQQSSRVDPNAEPDVNTMSPEQKRAYFKHFEADDDFVTGFASAFVPDQDGNIKIDAVRKGIGALRDGFVAQSVRTAELMVQQTRNELLKQFQPALEVAHKQREQDVWNEFTREYPGLAPFKQVVEATATGFNPQAFTSRKQLMDAVAGAAEQMLKAANPAFSARQAIAQQTQQAPQYQPAQQFYQQPAGQQFPAPSGAGFMPQTASPGMVFPSQQTTPRKGSPFYDVDTFGS